MSPIGGFELLVLLLLISPLVLVGLIVLFRRVKKNWEKEKE